MSRGLKFRVWDEKYRCWDDVPMMFYPGEEVKKQGRIIQWSTGLSDKNGKEIYEGDIVNFPHHTYRTNGKIIWENLSWIIHEPGYVHKSLADFLESDIEIIGNIFELPCKFDHNAECLICDCWPSDCPYKTQVN